MKKIGVEISRLYVVEVDDEVDTNDWMEVGMVVADLKAPPEYTEVLGWELPDGDLDSEASEVQREMAYQRRVQNAILMVAREYNYSDNDPLRS